MGLLPASVTVVGIKLDSDTGAPKAMVGDSIDRCVSSSGLRRDCCPIRRWFSSAYILYPVRSGFNCDLAFPPPEH